MVGTLVYVYRGELQAENDAVATRMKTAVARAFVASDVMHRFYEEE